MHSVGIHWHTDWIIYFLVRCPSANPPYSSFNIFVNENVNENMVF